MARPLRARSIADGPARRASRRIGLAIGFGATIRFVGAWVAGVASDWGSRKVVLVPSLILMVAGAGILALPVTVPSWVAALAGIVSAAVFAAATLAVWLWVSESATEPGRDGGEPAIG